MRRLTDQKIVLVRRPTRLDELIARFNTEAQARFYIEHQGADFGDYQREAERYADALLRAERILETLGRLQVVDRSFLPNFLFAPEDTIVTLGQDGLVANTLKYLHGQPVIGVNPEPERWDGQLLPFTVGDLPKIVPEVFGRKRKTIRVTMAEATLNNGQTMCAVNDLFIGPKSHGSARYTLTMSEREEQHSSSGVIVSTGLGSTGWFKSLLNGANAIASSMRDVLGSDPGVPLESPPPVKTEFPWDAEQLYFTVREPFPTKNTSASLVFGRITNEHPLTIQSQMAENGVIFSDGIEKDFLDFNSGTQAVIRLSQEKGIIVV